jgi:hypothetical protein
LDKHALCRNSHDDDGETSLRREGCRSRMAWTVPKSKRLLYIVPDILVVLLCMHIADVKVFFHWDWFDE